MDNNEHLLQTIWGLAAYDGHFKILDVLLKDGRVNVNHVNPATGNTALMFACRDRKVEIIDILLREDSLFLNHVNRLGDTALHLVIKGPKVKQGDIVDMLLQHDDIEVGIRNYQGETPFELACKLQNVNLVGILYPRYVMDDLMWETKLPSELCRLVSEYCTLTYNEARSMCQRRRHGRSLAF